MSPYTDHLTAITPQDLQEEKLTKLHLLLYHTKMSILSQLCIDPIWSMFDTQRRVIPL